MQRDPFITISMLAEEIGISERAIKRTIQKLQVQGIIRRIGPDKGGHWEVLDSAL
jgi:ATP-dependent DNA helicase RecG